MFRTNLIVLVSATLLGFLLGQKLSNDLEMVNAVKQITLIDKRGLKAVNLISSERNGDIHKANDFKSNFCIGLSSENLLIRVFEFNDQKLIYSKARLFYNVIIIDSLDAFHHAISIFPSINLYFGGYYVIVYEDASYNDMSEIFKRLWDFYIHNVNILTRDKVNGSIFVSTFFPFRNLQCNKTTPIRVAEFKDRRFLYQPPSFFPDKFDNFHQCPLKISTFESLSPAVLREEYENGSYSLYGRDVDVMKALATEFNFTIELFYVTPYGGWGNLYPNGTFDGAFGRAIGRESDFIIGNVFLKLERALRMEFSYPYFIDQLVLMIPPGKPLTSFQKLLRPFQYIVWINLFGIILGSFVVIALLHFQSNRIKEFVYGKKVKHPFLNVLIAIFGGTQHFLPTRNFSRSLLMMFLLLCLVLR